MAIFINIAGSDGTREFHVWFQTCRHYVLNIYLGYSLPIHKHISLSNWQYSSHIHLAQSSVSIVMFVMNIYDPVTSSLDITFLKFIMA